MQTGAPGFGGSSVTDQFWAVLPPGRGGTIQFGGEAVSAPTLALFVASNAEAGVSVSVLLQNLMWSTGKL